jgi:hypothetical protein
MTQSGLEPTIYRTRGDHANQYTTDAVLTFQGSIIDHIDGHQAQPSDQLLATTKLATNKAICLKNKQWIRVNPTFKEF